MDIKIRSIFEKTLNNHYINREKCGLWILSGESENSFVGISDDEPIEYQLFFYHNNEDFLEEKEIKILFHEISHIIIFEDFIKKKGLTRLKVELEKYEDGKKLINLSGNDDLVQEQYRELFFEKEANEMGEKLYNQMKEEEKI
jgi:hypothetical protein